MDHLFDEIRDYLIQKECKIEYPIIVNHFKRYLYNPDSEVQSQIRTQFKDYVNRLATVSVENNMKFIVLRPEYRQQIPTTTERSTDSEVLTPKHEETNQMPPPRPPPRRRQSNASLFSRPIDKSRTNESRSHNELNDLVKKSPGKVKERALRLNSHSVSGNLHSMVNLVKSNSMRENRLTRDSTMSSSSSASHRLGYNPSMRSRSSHREDESDSSSFQPMDMLRKRWIIEACECNHDALYSLLVEDQTLSTYKDTVGYTALHWAARNGHLDIIHLLVGRLGVSVDIRTNSGYTPLHLAYMFKRNNAINLLLNNYKANPGIRDYAGRRPHQLAHINKI